MTTTYVISLTLPREEAIAVCTNYDKVSEGDIDALIYCFEIIESLVETLEMVLAVDGINPYEMDSDD
jgi:hypothetical protein